MQQANLAIEQGAVGGATGRSPMAGAEDVAIVVVQFAPVAERFSSVCRPAGDRRVAGRWENIAVAAAQRGVG
ncbi:MAG: hypothetical protein HS113_18095 [Verrucomicrobiales bacterium]|nr:hypothetical protein [Verrucomicrobiales bacterium]